MEFNKEELRELKTAINSIISQRLTYKITVQDGSKRQELNDKYLKQDYELLEKVIKEIDAYDE